MQAMDALGRNERVGVGRGYWKVLALCLALTACQAPSSQASTETAAPASIAAASPTAPSGPASADSPHYPDASYTEGRLRPAYGWCVDGVEDAGKLQACGKDELAYQEARLEAAASKALAGLDAAARTAFQATQASWRSDTDRYCRDVPNGSVQQLQGAQECRLYRVANRADQLLAQSAPPDTSYTQAALRPEYTRCVQDARGMDDQLEACDTAELAHHKALLEAQVARLMDGPDGPAKDRWMDEQANWAADTEKRCAPASDHVGPMLDAQSCRINRYANRVVELHTRVLTP